MQANTDEMDRANHADETKWLLPAYVADKPHQPKYSQVSILLKASPFSAVFTVSGSLFQHSTDLTANEYFRVSILAYWTATLWAVHIEDL